MASISKRQIAKAAFASPSSSEPAPAAAAHAEAAAPVVDEKAKEKAEESGMEGLGALFGLRRIHIFLQFLFFLSVSFS